MRAATAWARTACAGHSAGTSRGTTPCTYRSIGSTLTVCFSTERSAPRYSADPCFGSRRVTGWLPAENSAAPGNVVHFCQPPRPGAR